MHIVASEARSTGDSPTTRCREASIQYQRGDEADYHPRAEAGRTDDCNHRDDDHHHRQQSATGGSDRPKAGATEHAGEPLSGGPQRLACGKESVHLLTRWRRGPPSPFPEILRSSDSIGREPSDCQGPVSRLGAGRAGRAGQMKVSLSGPSNTMTLRRASLRFTPAIASLISSRRYWREISSSSLSLPV